MDDNNKVILEGDSAVRVAEPPFVIGERTKTAPTGSRGAGIRGTKERL